MPELPEVETIRRGLVPFLTGRRLVRVEVRRADLRVPFPENFAVRLAGRQVQVLRRRAKYLLADLDGGETLVVHMGMSGRFTVHACGDVTKPGRFAHKMQAEGSAAGKHDHVVFHTDDGTRIVFTDHRRFGLMLLAKTAELDRHELFAGLGPEPLDNSFTPELLGSVIEGKRTPIKAALLDQRVVAGLGTSTFARPCFARAFRRSGLLVRWRESARSAWPPRSRRSLKRLFRPGARHCATMPRPMGNWDTSSITSRSTTATPCVVPAKAAPAPCAASSNPAARPFTAPYARGERTH